MRWLWTHLQTRIGTAIELDFDIEETQKTLARMEMDTGRIELLKIS